MDDLINVALQTDALDVFIAVAQALASITAVLVSIVALNVAGRQAATDETRLNHELFDRRFEIFRAFQEFFVAVCNGNASTFDDDIIRFEIRTAPAAFILDDSFTDYIAEVRRKALDIAYLDKEFDIDAPQEARLANMTKRRERHDWFSTELRGLQEKFAPYLRLKP